MSLKSFCVPLSSSNMSILTIVYYDINKPRMHLKTFQESFPLFQWFMFFSSLPRRDLTNSNCMVCAANMSKCDRFARDALKVAEAKRMLPICLHMIVPLTISKRCELVRFGNHAIPKHGKCFSTQNQPLVVVQVPE